MKESLSAPGFRFHPTDEELVVFYLKRKICQKKLIDVIGETDVYKWDPEELPGLALLKSGDRQWFFFTSRGRKYPNGARSSRATATGYWKATGKDRTIMYSSRAVGVKKTLVFYRGRAPNGERTDWVMHEYTLDEEELNRCQNARDYYALYKLFKKSGAGPKNGEQYGAPFREEDWADDDDDRDATKVADSEVPANQTNKANLVDDVIANGLVDFPLDDIEDFFKGLAEETLLPPPQVEGVAHVTPQAVGEEQIQNVLVPSSSREVILPDTVEVFAPIDQQYSGHTSFDLTQLLPSGTNELTEITSGLKIGEPAPLILEEGFIEIDDLLSPQPPVPSTEKPVQNLKLDEFDGFSEFDLLFHDVAMSFEDSIPIGQEMVPHPYVSPFGNNAANQMQSYAGDRIQQQRGENQNMDPNWSNTDHINNGLWAEEQRSCVFAQPQSNGGNLSPPASGAIYEHANPPAGVCSQDQEGEETGGTSSQFSSALWALMESIPHKPASAAEDGPLVNRVFVRMSSFNRVRLNTTNSDTNSSNDAAFTIKRSGRIKGKFLLSVLGVLCAIFWVFLAAARVPEKSIFS